MATTTIYPFGQSSPIGGASYIVAWDGASTPVPADIPLGVSVTYNGTTYTGSLTASASTQGNIYLVAQSADPDVKDMYITATSGGNYVWSKMGSSNIDLSGYATDEELEQVVPTVVENGFFLVDSDRNIGYRFDEDGITGPTTIITALIMSLLENVMVTTVEDGFFIIDADRNIGFMTNVSGAHSANLVEY